MLNIAKFENLMLMTHKQVMNIKNYESSRIFRICRINNA